MAHGDCWAFINITRWGKADWGIKKEWHSTFENSCLGANL